MTHGWARGLVLLGGEEKLAEGRLPWASSPMCVQQCSQCLPGRLEGAQCHGGREWRAQGRVREVT